jgi:hypothetical protein
VSGALPNPTFTKAQRRRLHELHSVAYERELSNELEKLEGEFKRHAIHRGLIKKEEAGSEMMELLADQLAFLGQQGADG